MEGGLNSSSAVPQIDDVSSGDENFLEIKSKILSKEYQICSKKGRSAVWNIFGKIKTNAGIELENIVACRTCWNVYKFNKNSTSNLVRHKCYKTMKENVSTSKLEVSADLKHTGINILTGWVVVNCRPFQIVQDSGLLKFSEFLVSIGAKYGPHVNVEALLPHPSTISRNISSLYDKTVAIVKNELQFMITNGSKIGYGLTSDIWTDNFIRTSYMSLTIHYIKDGELINRLLGLSAFKGERCENIQHKMLKILKFHDLLVENATFVTDRGTNMKKAFKSYANISCINHLLNNVLEDSVEAVPELDDICDKATKLVKYFKKSGENSNLQSTLKSCSPTRWNTVFYMLSSIKKNWTEINSILQRKRELSKLDGINLNYVEEILKVLEVFEESSKELEGENYPTLHLVLPHVYRLKDICAINETDLSFIKQFKSKLSDMLDTTVLQNLTIYHKVAVFLFPPTNKLVFFNENDKILIRNECRTQMSNYVNETANQDEQSTSANPPTRKSQLFNAFLQTTQVSNGDDIVFNELVKYESTNVTYYDDFNVIQWWHLHRLEFPLLYKVANSLLATPASSAASERVFSKARHLISEKRSAIGCSSFSVHQIMFLHNNMDIKLLH